jgi:hypothetical protein
MHHKVQHKEDEQFPSLYDAFRLGDRVCRKCTDARGKHATYEGIVLAIGEDSIEVFWDTLNGKFRPENMDVDFTTCSRVEIFQGTMQYSPIIKNKKISLDISFKI